MRTIDTTLETHLFQSTLSVRRATLRRTDVEQHRKISIHALREESDPMACMAAGDICLFQSTLSVRRATLVSDVAIINGTISIHALREESDRPVYTLDPNHVDISIHALREESDRVHM